MNRRKIMTISDLRKKDNFFLLAGPCVIEGEELALRIADRIVKITDKLGIPLSLIHISYFLVQACQLEFFTQDGVRFANSFQAVTVLFLIRIRSR